MGDMDCVKHLRLLREQLKETPMTRKKTTQIMAEEGTLAHVLRKIQGLVCMTGMDPGAERIEPQSMEVRISAEMRHCSLKRRLAECSESRIRSRAYMWSGICQDRRSWTSRRLYGIFGTLRYVESVTSRFQCPADSRNRHLPVEQSTSLG